MHRTNFARRLVLKSGLAAGSLFLPVPYAWVWAQSEGALKLLLLPKVALVIGNSAYKNTQALKNPANDARAIAGTLKSAGFEVTVSLDANHAEMTLLLQSYTRTLAAKKCVGLFYFAGHGLQLAWRNYLVPVEAAIDSMDNVPRQCVDLGSLIEGITKAANPMNVIVLDACRDNPFGRSFRDAQRGLSQMDAPLATFLAYATSPGNVASDGEGENGLYTEYLLKEIKVPEAKIEDVFKRVRLGVRRKTNGAQIPWESTSLEDDFWFIPPTELKKLSEDEKNRLFNEELALWEKARESKALNLLENYLHRYPNGNFSEMAQLQLDRVLAKQGEKKIEIVSAEGNPYTKGSAIANTAYKVGDSYTIRSVEPISRVERGRRTSTVTKITDDEVLFDNGAIVDLLGNQVRYPDPDGRYVKGVQSVPLEYAVGKRWSNRFIATRPDGRRALTEMEMTIVAREKVTVPAGSFDAFRIDARGYAATPKGPLGISTSTWRDPSVRQWVAREETHRIGGREIFSSRFELVAYKES